MDKIEIFFDLQIVTYINVAFLVLLCYDYTILFAEEISYVWFSKWGFIKVLYLVTRYAPLIDTLLAAEERLHPSNTASCDHTQTFTTIFAGAGIGISVLILMIRTYAMFKRSRKVLAIFGLSWLVIGVVNIYGVIHWTSKFSEEQVTLHVSGIPSCFLATHSNLSLVCYISLLTGETVLVVLTLWCGLRNYLSFQFSEATEKFILLFCKDGVFFYVFLLAITIANVLVLLLAPPIFQHLLDSPLRVMHSILSCRLVIHFRAVADADANCEVEFEKSLDDLDFEDYVYSPVPV